MRKIFAFIMTTLDGYYAGLDQEFDFWVVDEEFNEFAVEQLGKIDTLVFGRVTYEGMAAYWPTPAAEQDDPRVAARMNSLKKIVVSRTLDTAEWANTRLIKNDVSEELATSRSQRGERSSSSRRPATYPQLLRLRIPLRLRRELNERSGDVVEGQDVI